MRILQEDFIRKHFDHTQAYEDQRQGFIAHSQNKTLSSVAHFNLNKGSLHIKSGVLSGDKRFFVKLATGFSENWRMGLPTGDGCILSFCSETGQLEAILMDKGYLTDMRTALAARICIETFQPKDVESVGILGTGIQARLCARQQLHASRCNHLLVWGRNKDRVNNFKDEMEAEGFQVQSADHPDTLLERTDVIITTTASKEHVLKNTRNRRSKLIVAVGADEVGKQELATELVASADLLVADDVKQSIELGEFQHAVRLNQIKRDSILELGSILLNGHSSSPGLVICDLSGIPIQDVQIANAILCAESKRS
jgi:ornithine cyclodeaminase